MTRRLLTALLFSLCFSSVLAQAAHDFNRMGYRNALKFSTLKVFGSAFELNYERMLHNRSSVMLSASMNSGSNEDETRAGVSGEFQYRFYFNPWDYRERKKETTTDWYGLYVAPYANFAYTRLDRHSEWWDWQSGQWFADEGSGTYNTYGAGLVLGTQFAVQSKFTFDFFLGGGGRLTQLIEGTGTRTQRDPLSPVYTGVTPRIGIKVGIAY